MLNRKISDELKAWLVVPALIGLTVASTTAIAKPPEPDKPSKANKNSKQEVGVYAVNWGNPECSSFSLKPVDGYEIKEISNIVLSCASNTAGEVTWSKWEFTGGTPYVFGTVLPTELEPTEGNGCVGQIGTAYVKAGSIKSGKGLEGVDDFNGHLGGELPCTPPIGGS